MRFRKLGLFIAIVLIAAAAIGTPRAAQACHNWTDYFTYYSDATKTVQVGWCEFDCGCVTYCDGQQTSYYRVQTWPGCL